MTKPEFTGQFVRLCKGFHHDATDEQTEAWFRRIGHIGLSVWAETVTTCLCGKYFPKLDEALNTAEHEAESQRKAAVSRDQPKAQRIHAAIESGEGTMLSPALFNAIKAFCGREQIRHYLALVQDAKHPYKWTTREMTPQVLKQREQDLTAELAKWLPQLTDAETTEFLDRYGDAVAR